MARQRRPDIAPKTRQAIKDMAAQLPRRTYRQIAEHFNVPLSTVGNVMFGSDIRRYGHCANAASKRLHEPGLPRATPDYRPPRMTAGITLSLLTSGRAPRAKLQPA